MKYFWQEETLYNMLFLHCNESVIVFDERGIIVDANPAACRDTGYQDRILGKNISDIYPGIFFCMDGEIKIVPGFEEGQETETIAYCENQLCYPVRAKVSGLADDIGFRICMAENLMTQTEAVKGERAALQEMQQVNQMRNEFVANVTHELRTPVNGISGIASNLMEGSLTGSQRQNVELILRCCSNMGKIIDDLLDFSKIEAGKMVIECQEFSIKTMLEETLEFHRNAAQEKGLRLMVNIAPELPDYVMGDSLRLGQVIHNLLSNAVKFTSDGYIAFEAMMTGHTGDQAELFFRVSDTGIGIEKEKMNRLFQSFSQGDGSITRQFGGTGLGLAISKKLVGMMGGSIRVDSKPEKGSVFYFTIQVRLPDKEKDRLRRLEHDDRERIAKQLSEPLLFPVETPTERRKKQCDTLEKLLICVEMEAWEKAEMFAGQVKLSIPKTDAEWYRAAFRLEMDIRKENYEKAIEGIRTLQEHFHAQ